MDNRYEVFISFKSTDEAGHATPDRVLARDLHDFLESRGLRVFASDIDLQQRGVAAFKRAIDEALDQARVLVVVGTSADNMRSEWVRYEWESFSQDVITGIKPEGRVFAYLDNVVMQALPRSLRYTQAILHGAGSFDRLHEFVVNALAATSSREESLRQVALDANFVARARRVLGPLPPVGRDGHGLTAVLKTAVAPAILLVGVWAGAVALLDLSEVILPSPVVVARTLEEQWSSLLRESGRTLLTASAGIGLGGLMGTLLGLGATLAGIRVQTRRLYAVSVLWVPIIGSAPLILLWFGMGLTPVLLSASLIAPLALDTTADLLTDTGGGQIRIKWGIPLRRRSIRKPEMSHLSPVLFRLMKAAIPLAVFGSMVGERFSSFGIGSAIVTSTLYLDTGLAIAGILVIWSLTAALVGFTSYFELRRGTRALSIRDSVSLATEIGEGDRPPDFHAPPPTAPRS